MVAFNFTVNIEKIGDGTKKSTIRKTKRCNVGDMMQLYTGQRTKACRKLKESPCVGVAPITIDENGWEMGAEEGKPYQRTPLHEQEGFKNLEDMIDFFRSHYGLPFTGYLHAWR